MPCCSVVAPVRIYASRQSVEGQSADSRELQQIFERYFEGYLQLFPTFATSIGDHRFDDQFEISISEEHRAKQRELYLKSLGELTGIKTARLEADSRLNYAVLEYSLTLRLQGLQFHRHLLPVRQLGSTPIEFPLLGSGSGEQPFKTPADYDNFLKRIERFQDWVNVAIKNMRLGTEQGIVQPRVVMERTLPQLEAMIVTDPQRSIFFQPILQMPASIGTAEKNRLTAAYTQAIQKEIVPTYRKLHSFIQDEYLPKTRATVGMSDLPNGNDWYDYLVKRQTTTDLTPEEIFQLGMEEVQRIKSEMERMRSENGFQGNLQEFSRYLVKNAPPGFANRDDLVKGYEAIRKKVTLQLPRLFGRLPKAPLEIRTIEPFREQSAPSQYWPATPDGSRPGIFYVNASGIDVNPRRASESLFLHEAVPGHHLQPLVAARANRLAAVPPLRRLHRLRRGMGPLRRVSRATARTLHGTEPVFQPFELGVIPRRAPGGRCRIAPQALVERPGDEIYDREHRGKRIGAPAWRSIVTSPCPARRLRTRSAN